MTDDDDTQRSLDRILAEVARDKRCRVVDIDPTLETFVRFELQLIAERVRQRVTARLLEQHGIGDRDTPLAPEGYERELPREQGRLPRGVG